MEKNTQAYKAVTRICLNNWHYIDHKILSLNREINFFTGHSGSGKSTVIDALQIVLYANTDGRSFFNKAAAEDSDRSLIEYLRGMINIGENNQARYKRNQNFSTTIVLELEQTITKEKECAGIIFDVETSTNDTSRLFFWHKGALFDNAYRNEKRAMSLPELKDVLQREYGKEEQFFTSSNERFRRNLYEIYLGGLDMEKFPRLFKRAIPFRMDIRLEQFVKEYICTGQDIHMEDMQESVILYGRMHQKIQETLNEIEELTEIEKQYRKYELSKEEMYNYNFQKEKLMILALEQSIKGIQDQVQAETKDLEIQKNTLSKLLLQREDLGKEYDEINREMAGIGYADLEEKSSSLTDQIVLLKEREEKWKRLSAQLEKWQEEEIVSNQILWDIDKFKKCTIAAEVLMRLKKSLADIREEAEAQRREAASESRTLKKETETLEKDLAEMKQGKKAYPRDVEQARHEISQRLYEICGKAVPVRILSDLLDIRDESWRNAIEGYLGNHKLSLIVDPAYVKQAMEIYQSLDSKKYFRVSLVDTEKIISQKQPAKENSLAQEIQTKESYVKAFVDYLLGNVMKCKSLSELRNQKTGVTAECYLYQNYQLRRMNPDNYTKNAYIGEKSKKQRQKELQQQLEVLQQKKKKFDEAESAAERLLQMEYLSETTDEYLSILMAMEAIAEKETLRSKVEQKMQEIGSGTVEALKDKLSKVKKEQNVLEKELDQVKLKIHERNQRLESSRLLTIAKNEELIARKKELKSSPSQEEEFAQRFGKIKNPVYDRLLVQAEKEIRRAEDLIQEERNRLVDNRSLYLKNHPNRDFSASEESNAKYTQLLEELTCDNLSEYQKKADDQAKIAVGHFKEDFIYKVRSAIKEAYLRRDELNHIIKRLNFGKDKYQFKITKNKGLDGQYYDMFMDESLDINPETLSETLEHQMNMFSMDHESRYKTQMNDLIHIFIPPESADAREQEEARRNMEKYTDYRTYLSFEMEQIIEGDERLVIGLSKMIKKNSGGEGQNPLYVALLASFAQAYHINLTPRLSRYPSIRLVVLDEAFSKMDAEKVASCIELIRGLGFQAIISATNDKIQNYLENVDKTFVYANPDKKSISIQEFEKKDFKTLAFMQKE